MEENIQTLGFIGIGLMGKPMVLRFLEAGFKVNVWNRTKEKLKIVIEKGAIAYPSITDLVHQSDIIMLCLANTEVVENIVNHDILTTDSKGKQIIDLSSIDPEKTREFAHQVKQKCQMRWVDAPVSGGTTGAEQGTLAIMAGGTLTDIQVAQQVLKPLYKQFTHVGDVGSGQVCKICNQMVVSCNVLVIAEMMALAQKSGINVNKIPEALTGGFADSKPLQIIAPQMASEQFEPIKWRVQTLLKDLNMAVNLSNQQECSTPMSGLAAQLMQLHSNQGFLEQDPATLIKLFQHYDKTKC